MNKKKKTQTGSYAFSILLSFGLVVHSSCLWRVKSKAATSPSHYTTHCFYCSAKWSEWVLQCFSGVTQHCLCLKLQSYKSPWFWRALTEYFPPSFNPVSPSQCFNSLPNPCQTLLSVYFLHQNQCTFTSCWTISNAWWLTQGLSEFCIQLKLFLQFLCPCPKL